MNEDLRSEVPVPEIRIPADMLKGKYWKKNPGKAVIRKLGHPTWALYCIIRLHTNWWNNIAHLSMAVIRDETKLSKQAEVESYLEKLKKHTLIAAWKRTPRGSKKGPTGGKNWYEVILNP